MEQSPLFDRIGGRDGIYALIEQVVANHFANPAVCTRYEHGTMSRDELVRGAAEFFCTGLSGVPTYEGKPLAAVHAGMNISDHEFVAVIDDILAAMTARGIGELEQAEALKILWGMKGEVVGL
jgi:hemoglobin